MPPRPPTLLDAEKLFAWAVRQLAARAHSAGELAEKLRRKAERREDVPAVVARLKEFGYLDDRKFAEGYAASRLGDRGYGARRVERELRGRRVAPALAERTVRQAYAGVDEEALIEDFLRRKCRVQAPFGDRKALASAYGRLLRAGFTPGTALHVLRRFAAEPELLDGLEPPQEESEE